MAKNHGAKQQKKLAKQKAKRMEKRTHLFRRESNDPTVRLARAGRWPVVQALAGADLWEDGIGYLLIARQESEGGVVFAVYLVDVYCLGVKNAFWRAGTPGDLKDIIRDMDKTQKMRPIAPACLAKIVKGAVEYARALDFPPHADYRHASALLEGIDPATCPQEFTFGRDGKPFYIRGPHETLEQAKAIAGRIHEAGGHYVIPIPDPGSMELAEIEGEFEEEDWPEDRE